MVGNTSMLAILYILAHIAATVKLFCKSSAYNNLVCILGPDSYENPEVECCDYVSDLNSILPDCSSYFEQYSLTSNNPTYTFKCDSGHQVQIYHQITSDVYSRNSRMLYIQCNTSTMSVSLNVYTVSII
jgi:hypothetical protein